MPGEKVCWSLIKKKNMNKKVSEIIEDINSLSTEEKKEIFKILFLKPLSDNDLSLTRWIIDGIQEVRSADAKLDKIAEILSNAKRRA